MNSVEIFRQFSYAAPSDPWLKRRVIHALEWASGKRRLVQIYTEMIERLPQSESYFAAALDQLRIRLDYDAAQLARVPREGPLIFVANHPFGVVDGLAACHLALRSRGEFQVLIQQALCRDERTAAHFLPIDFTETEAAVHTNIRSKRRALATLRAGGTLVLFPAGQIQRAPHLFAPPTDAEWKVFVAKLVQMSEATVVPLFFHGRNSLLFHAISHLSLTLRLSLILHEVTNKMGRPLRVEIGDPIPYAEMASFESRRVLVQFLRERTFGLGDGPRQETDAQLWKE